MLSKIKTISSKLLALGLVVAILIVALIGLDFYQKAKQKQGLNENQLLKAPKEKIIDYELQTITNPNSLEEDSNTIVKYRYISEKEVPAATYEGLKEDLTKRTNNSQAFLKSVKPISDELQQEEYVAKFYSGQPFEKSGDKWYYVETATTTPTAFISQTKLTLLDQVKEFFGQKALADAIDVTTGEGDGYIFDSNSRYWNATHDNTSAIGVDNNGTSALIETFISIDSENCTISRAFLPFDTSSLSVDADITSAFLGIYVTDIDDEDNDGNDFIRVVQTSQASSATLAGADYDQCGAIDNPTAGATDIDLGNFSPLNNYTMFTLNSTGYTWIKKSGQGSNCGTTAGVTCLGLREGHDVVDNQIDDLATNSVTFSTVEAGASYDPYLIVGYTIVAPAVIKIDGGTIKIDGGTIKIN